MFQFTYIEEISQRCKNIKLT